MGTKVRSRGSAGGDRLVAKMNDLYAEARDIRFTSATEAVVCGLDLEATGNRSVGSNIYISTGPRFEPAPGDVVIGATLRVGDRESYPRCELRCTRRRGEAVVAVYARDGTRLTRELRCPAHEGDVYDEGLFAWFGPVEWIGTPWSDNDPSTCQIVTVHGLREYARSFRRR